jgi:uncharacterized protein YjiK
MKQTLVLICSVLLVASTYAFNTTVNEKVLKSFKQTFNTAEQVKWEEFRDYYTVSFVNSGIRSKVNYDKDGNMLSSIRYYSPNMLPLNVIGKLKKQYPSQSLYGVTEITYGDETVYYVKLEDAKNWTTVKIDNEGSCQVYEKFKKA